MNRRDVLIAGAASLIAPPAFAQQAAADPKLIDDLVAANRILADQGVVDGFGHVSARHDKRPDHFLIARSLAPGVVTAGDILEVDFDGNTVDGSGRTSYLERFIHAEIYRARKDVNSVVHCHSPSVIPFSVSKEKLRAIYHVAGFLGEGVPVFEIRATGGAETDMLIRTPALGRALAASLGQSTVVLMRGHGATAVGASVRTAVMHAIYTQLAAQVESEALKLGPVTYLNAAEAQRAAAQNDALVDRSWEIWRARAMGK